MLDKTNHWSTLSCTLIDVFTNQRTSLMIFLKKYNFLNKIRHCLCSDNFHNMNQSFQAVATFECSYYLYSEIIMVYIYLI